MVCQVCSKGKQNFQKIPRRFGPSRYNLKSIDELVLVLMRLGLGLDEISEIFRTDSESVQILLEKYLPHGPRLWVQFYPM